MDAFISYSNKDRKMAHATKSALDDFGVTGFLAHEDLQISEEWRDAIIEKLGIAKIFVALLSADFKASEWCPQEIGFAVARPEVLIIPLSLDGTVPFGFISKLQSKRVRAAEDIPALLRDVLLKKRPRIAIPACIKQVEDAGSYRGAEAVVSPLVPYFASFTKDEVMGFLAATLGNSQVWDAALCKTEYLPAFARQHWAIIPKKVRRDLLTKLEMKEREIAAA